MDAVLTLHETKQTTAISLSTSGRHIEDLLDKCWLLTNQRGGYASSTIVGCNTRGYHGLLIGSLNPPVNRIMALSNCLEMVVADQEAFNLSTFEFADCFAPDGFGFVKRFRKDTGVSFDYVLRPVSLQKTIHLLRDSDTVVLSYSFTDVKQPVDFIVRPFMGMRDYHTLQKSYAPLCAATFGQGILVRHDVPGSCELLLSCPSMDFESDSQWWFNFVYRDNKARGQDFTEDLWTPGFFKCRVESQTELVFWASLRDHWQPAEIPKIDIIEIRDDFQRRHNALAARAAANNEPSRILCLAADQFIVKRKSSLTDRTTILAGFPWFADWGRDAFISLPGLLLCTGRFAEAKSVLVTFASAADEGMIPNCFDERTDAAHFNSVDASLWFINAAFEYLAAADDRNTFSRGFLPVIRWIVDSYQKGTRFGIHADTDGLITAGSETTQLTWMDARCDGISFTPRWGKAVEVNALWYNALCLLERYYAPRNAEIAADYHDMSARAGQSFCRLFWNEQKGYLNDTVFPDGTVDESLRPNQIFAVSLPFSPPLSLEQKRAVVAAVEKELLTPYGLRTLNTSHPAYKGIYEGPQRQRDEAYHNGTVWSYLLGVFVEAYLRVNNFSPTSREHGARLIQPLIQHITDQACLGSISEIFDGDSPHKPRGCFAQAWSVAELIRACRLVES